MKSPSKPSSPSTPPPSEKTSTEEKPKISSPSKSAPADATTSANNTPTAQAQAAFVPFFPIIGIPQFAAVPGATNATTTPNAAAAASAQQMMMQQAALAQINPQLLYSLLYTHQYQQQQQQQAQQQQQTQQQPKKGSSSPSTPTAGGSSEVPATDQATPNTAAALAASPFFFYPTATPGIFPAVGSAPASTATAATTALPSTKTEPTSAKKSKKQSESPPKSKKKKTSKSKEKEKEPAEPAEKKKKGASASSSSSSSASSQRQSRANKGLRHFSTKVCEKVQTKGTTTYNEVANELVAEFLGETQTQSTDEKNIRRRVYDALNVLMALGIITKDKKEIRWKGYPLNYQQEYSNLLHQKKLREESIKRKKQTLGELVRQQHATSNLYHRNSLPEYQSVDENSCVMLPFIIVHTAKDTVIECEMDEEGTEVFFNFNAPFEIHDDNEILFRLGMDSPVFQHQLQQVAAAQQAAVAAAAATASASLSSQTPAPSSSNAGNMEE